MRVTRASFAGARSFCRFSKNSRRFAICSGVASFGGSKTRGGGTGRFEGLGPAVGRGQPLVEVHDRPGEVVLPRRHAHAELARLAGEVLAVDRERAQALRIHLLDAHRLVVEVEADLERLRRRGPFAAEDQPDDEARGRREAVLSVDRVAQRQAGSVVFVKHVRARLDARARRRYAYEARRLRLGSVDGGARDAIGGDQVLLQERRREREHVAVVVEAVAGVVLREVLGQAQIDSEQVAHRVVVFGAVQAASGDAAGVGGCRARRARKGGLDPAAHGRDLVVRERRERRGRHHPRANLLDRPSTRCGRPSAPRPRSRRPSGSRRRS